MKEDGPPIRLHCRDYRELGDEAVVVKGHLSIDATRERVVLQLVLEDASGFLGSSDRSR